MMFEIQVFFGLHYPFSCPRTTTILLAAYIVFHYECNQRILYFCFFILSFSSWTCNNDNNDDDDDNDDDDNDDDDNDNDDDNTYIVFHYGCDQHILHFCFLNFHQFFFDHAYQCNFTVYMLFVE